MGTCMENMPLKIEWQKKTRCRFMIYMPGWLSKTIENIKKDGKEVPEELYMRRMVRVSAHSDPMA